MQEFSIGDARKTSGSLPSSIVRVRAPAAKATGKCRILGTPNPCHLSVSACISDMRPRPADMQNFPHHYAVTATGCGAGGHRTEGRAGCRLCVRRRLPSLMALAIGGRPKRSLVAAIGDCLILTFRAVARASGLAWTSLECSVTGTLDRLERITRFVAFDIRARLRVPSGTSRLHTSLGASTAEPRTCSGDM